MSTTTKIELAVEVAERFMSRNGYGHGICLGASVKQDAAAENWEVEFAYEGLMNRSPTSDPPSIVLLVNLKTEDVSTLELM